MFTNKIKTRESFTCPRLLPMLDSQSMQRRYKGHHQHPYNAENVSQRIKGRHVVRCNNTSKFAVVAPAHMT